MSKANKKKRRSQAPVALVYFVTMIIFFGIIGTASVFTLKHYGLLKTGTEDTQEELNIRPSFTTLYARVNSKGVLADMTFVRLSPRKNSIAVIPISAYTVSEGEGKTLRDIYKDDGIKKLQEAVSKTFDISIDYYMTISNTSFETVSNVFGGIPYTPTEELYYLSMDNDENDISLVKGEVVNLSGRQIRLLCQYPVFSSEKKGNNEFLGYAVTQLINNAFQQTSITKDSLDNIYSIITEKSTTDMKKSDFEIQKKYLKKMLDDKVTPAKSYIPEGTWTDKTHFTVSEGFKEKLKDAFDDGAVSIKDDKEAREAIENDINLNIDEEAVTNEKEDSTNN